MDAEQRKFETIYSVLTGPKWQREITASQMVSRDREKEIAREIGFTFDPAYERACVVHTRQDIATMSLQLNQADIFLSKIATSLRYIVFFTAICAGLFVLQTWRHW